jgi:hypothetical protein
MNVRSTRPEASLPLALELQIDAACQSFEKARKAVASGCPRLGQVTGKVLYKDKPLPSGTVLFVGPDGRRRGFSPIGPDGTYHIEKVPVGPVKIAVVSEPRVPPGLMNAPGPGPPSDPPKNDYVPIPTRYKDAEQSGLAYTVEAGRQTHNLALMP